MKRLLIISVATFLVLLLSVRLSSAFAFRNIKPGDKAPDFELLSLDGKQVSLSSHSGNIVVLLLWATDTESKEQRSVELLRTMEAVLKEHEGRGVSALSINFDKDGREKVADIIKQNGVTFPTLFDEGGGVYGSYGVFILPTIGIIDRDGTLKKAYGYTHDLDKIVDGEVQVLLGLKTEEELASELAPKEVVEKPKELKDAGRHLNLGNIMLERRMFDQARHEFEQAAELDPNSADAFIELGFLLIREGKYNEALAQLVKGLELEPESARAHAGVGLAYFQKGQLEEAIDELEWALEINPRDAKTFYQLGLVYEKKGEQQEALKRYKRALKLIFKD